MLSTSNDGGHSVDGVSLLPRLQTSRFGSSLNSSTSPDKSLEDWIAASHALPSRPHVRQNQRKKKEMAFDPCRRSRYLSILTAVSENWSFAQQDICDTSTCIGFTYIAL
jgi:hypothetical protein